MFLTNASSIRDVLFFPHMRPLPNKNQEAEEKAEAEKTTK
jgi:hypothetical protein